jgi:hypothetical protein
MVTGMQKMTVVAYKALYSSFIRMAATKHVLNDAADSSQVLFHESALFAGDMIRVMTHNILHCCSKGVNN